MNVANNNKELYGALKQSFASGVTIDNMPVLELENNIDISDVKFYHIKELTFEEDSPRREAFENVISTLRIDGIIFVYLIVGDSNGVSFYAGVARDVSFSGKLELDIDDIGKRVLKPSIEGNFRGSKVLDVEKEKKAELVSKIDKMKRFAKVSGIPSVYKDKEDFQGIDRLIDIMSGEEFALVVLAKPMPNRAITDIEKVLFDAYNNIAPMIRTSVQQSDGSSVSSSTSATKGSSISDGTNYSESNQAGKNISKGTTNTESYSSSYSGNNSSSGTNESSGESSSFSRTMGGSQTKSENESFNKSESTSKNQGSNLSFEFTNKMASELTKYIDEVLLKRINYGKNKGLFDSCIYLMSNEKGNLTKLGNAIRAIFSGDESNKSPLVLSNLNAEKDINEIKCIKNFQIPKINLVENTNAVISRSLLSKNLSSKSCWMSANELSVIATLPKKEVVGLSLKEEVEFGLNVKNQISQDEAIFLGNMVQSGKELSQEIFIDKAWLDKHIFIAGVTGSGKTTTCQRILKSAKLPFLVIEPAKTEYRAMLNNMNDLLIFTLGDERVAPFRINPFEFFPHESISSRVDMIKANIEASFDMEAAIPQIIESALYRCYEEYGWDISTSKNYKFKDPFADGVFAFPTLSDLMRQANIVVEEQGFDERLKKDYIGSINARLQGLLVGSKAFMLNNPRSVDFTDLLERNVVLELEEVKNGAEKSLIMGFILININEALNVKYKEYKNKGKEFRHITLIEESHRLLSKFMPGDSPNKKLGVETFADMLAEVRKYGESLIIVDQIPNKLTPEVLKNTNTKIVHKIFAQDDKEAIGNTMALNDEQKEFLSNLETGRAVVSNPNFIKPIQVQIAQLENVSTTKSAVIDSQILRDNILAYYKQNYKKGVVPSIEKAKIVPDINLVEDALQYDFHALELEWLRRVKDSEKIALGNIRQMIDRKKIPNDTKYLSGYVFDKFYKNQDEEMYENIKKCVELVFEKIVGTSDNEVLFGDYADKHLKEYMQLNF